MNQQSFDDVVTKLKKLFDEKIKFVRDDNNANTERIDLYQGHEKQKMKDKDKRLNGTT